MVAGPRGEEMVCLPVQALDAWLRELASSAVLIVLWLARHGYTEGRWFSLQHRTQMERGLRLTDATVVRHLRLLITRGILQERPGPSYWREVTLDLTWRPDARPHERTGPKDERTDAQSAPRARVENEIHRPSR